MDVEIPGAQILLGEPVRIQMHGEWVWLCVAKVKAQQKRLPFLGGESDRPPVLEDDEEVEITETVFATNGVGTTPASAIVDAKARLQRYARNRDHK